jgi:endogenous inhibitor of DNA gyrase (YacG/DUF329 family)
MIRGRCPICSKPFEVSSLDDLPSYPFCSKRCRLIDLGRWADGKYVLPANETPPASPPPGTVPGDDEADES